MVSQFFTLKNTRRGYTLIELLVVMALIGLLLTAGLTSYLGSQKNSRDGKRKADLEVLRQALELYRSDNPTIGYPGAVGNATTVLATPLSVPNTYINPANVPKDPQTNLNYYYYYQVNPGGGGVNTYRICTYLESPKSGDPACPNTAIECKTVGGNVSCNYGLTQP